LPPSRIVNSGAHAHLRLGAQYGMQMGRENMRRANIPIHASSVKQLASREEMPPPMEMGLHEAYTRDYRVEAASNRRFGIVVGGIALSIGAIRALLQGEVGIIAGLLGGVGLALILAALVKPNILTGANRGWSALGLLLHKITNPLFLGAIYLGAIVPTGLMMRLFGADPMGLRRKANGTYWIARGKTGSTAESLHKPF
jgi:hypothetical protein